MANTLRFKRGLVSGIPTAALGEPLFTTDTFDLYIGNGTGNTRFQKYIASGTTSQLLRGDGSLLTMPIVLTSPANGEVLKYNGTNWVNSSDAGVTGSGVAGQVTYWNGTGTVTGSNNLFWDATNSRLGVGTNSPGNDRLSVVGTGRFTQGLTSSTTFQQFAHYFYNGGGTNDIFASTTGNNAGSGNFAIVNTTNGGRLALLGASDSTIRMGNNTQTAATATNFVLHLATGNISINSASDNGLRFQVTGDGYFSGGLGVGGITYAYEGISLRRNLTGLTVAFGVVSSGTIQSDVTSGAYYFTTGAKTQAATFTLGNLYHYDATQGTFGAGSTVTNQYGFFAGSSIIGATNNYGFYGNIASGTGRWNLYMNGTAANYLAGSLWIGTTSGNHPLEVASAGNTIVYIRAGATSLSRLVFGTSTNADRGFIDYDNTAASRNMSFKIAETERMRLDASGNLGLAVTPSAWSSQFRAMHFLGNGASISGRTDVAAINVNSNWYWDGSNSRYIVNGFASTYRQYLGAHEWSTAPSGTAGNAITFTQAMTLDASGNLAVGTTTTTNRLEVWGSGNTAARIVGQSAGNATLILSSGGVTAYSIKSGNGDSSLRIDQDGTDRLTLTSGGNLLVGQTSNPYTQANRTVIGLNGTTDSLISMSIGGTAAAYLFASSTSLDINANSRPLTFSTTGAEKARIFNNGNFAIGTTTDGGFKLDVNGTMRVSGASTFNSTITIARGTDANVTNVNINSGVTPVSAFQLNTDQPNLRSILMARNGYSLVLGTQDVNRVTIDTTGAATFASSVTAGGLVSAATEFRLNNNTFQRIAKSDASGGYAGGYNLDYSSGGVVTHAATGAIAGMRYETGGTTLFFNNTSQAAGTTATERMRITSGGNLLVNTTSDVGYRLRINGTSYFDDNLRFPNLKGVVFVQTGGSLLGSISMDSSNQVTIDNNGFFGLSVGSNYTMTGGNLGIGHAQFGTSATRTISVVNGTAPSTSPTDAFQMYSNDVVAGNAAPHFRTENGAVIKLYQETTGVGNAIFSQGGGNSVLDDSTFDGYTLRQIVKALRNQGILA